MPSSVYLRSGRSLGSRLPDNVPVEIWNNILQEAISFDSNLALETNCSSATYLRFKSTYGMTSMEAYSKAETIRKKLRLVCHSWKAFADYWKYQDRWLRFDEHNGVPMSLNIRREKKWVPEYLWSQPIRLDIKCGRPGRELGSAIDRPKITRQAVEALFRMWRKWDVNRQGEIRIARMEFFRMISVDDALIKALCGTSEKLRHLVSLNIQLATRNPLILGDVSRSFPQLKHLTITMEGSGECTKETFSLPNLEVLFLHPLSGCFDITHWTFPRLHTVYLHPFTRIRDMDVTLWDSNLYPFLRRHSHRIKTLDLDDSALGEDGSQEFQLPIGFWNAFDALEFLRIDLDRTVMTELPNTNHPLNWLAHSKPVLDPSDILSTLTGWVQDQDRRHPHYIVLRGPYTEKVCKEDIGGVVGEALDALERRGTVLVDYRGKALVIGERPRR